MGQYKTWDKLQKVEVHDEQGLDELLKTSKCPIPLKPLTEKKKKEAMMTARSMTSQEVDDWIWVMLDSGAGAFVSGPKDYKYYDTVESPGSKCGQAYALAGDHEIPNEGQQEVAVETQERNVIALAFDELALCSPNIVLDLAASLFE